MRAYEGLVREAPSQWLMFEDVWREGPATTLETREAPILSAGGRAR